jgi:hypothetical protein
MNDAERLFPFVDTILRITARYPSKTLPRISVLHVRSSIAGFNPVPAKSLYHASASLGKMEKSAAF